MLNKDMNKIPENLQSETQVKTPETPNELGGFDISGVVKIFDPQTQEVFVEVRT